MSAPNEMRKYLGIMRGNKPVNTEGKKDMSMRDMLGKTRKINIRDLSKKSINEDIKRNEATNIDQAGEERKMSEYFDENNVTLDFEDLKVFPNGVIFGGTIDGQLQFTYKVTPDEKTSGVEVNYLDGFDAKDPENEEVVKKVDTYYDIFYKYWRDQLFKE